MTRRMTADDLREEMRLDTRAQIDAVIGLNTRELRERQKWSQRKLADYLHYYTGDPWDQSQVSKAERGQRPFTIVDLMTLSYIFTVSLIRLLHSGIDTDILFGPKLMIPEAQMLYDWILRPRPAEQLTSEQMEDQLVIDWPEPIPSDFHDFMLDPTRPPQGDVNGDD